MSNHTDPTRTVMKMVSASPTSDLEDVVAACGNLTWNQVFLELDRLSRSGHIALKQIHPGRYRVLPAHGVRPISTHNQGG